MANMTRWDPFQEMMSLRHAMDTLFENAMIGPFSLSGEATGWGLPVDLSETEDGFVVKASVPGVNPEDMEVTVNGDVLTIKGQLKGEEEREGQRYHLRERRFGSFTRSITLPAPVRADAVEAEYHNGVLMLTLPKTEDVKPKRISVRGSGQNQKMIEGQATKK